MRSSRREDARRGRHRWTCLHVIGATDLIHLEDNKGRFAPVAVVDTYDDKHGVGIIDLHQNGNRIVLNRAMAEALRNYLIPLKQYHEHDLCDDDCPIE